MNIIKNYSVNYDLCVEDLQVGLIYKSVSNTAHNYVMPVRTEDDPYVIILDLSNNILRKKQYYNMYRFKLVSSILTVEE